MKMLLVNTPQGQYELALYVVAIDRANYYSKVDGYEKRSKEWKEEVDYALDDEYECIDWILNNSNWEDWRVFVSKVNDEVKVTDEDFWKSSDIFEIKDI